MYVQITSLNPLEVIVASVDLSSCTGAEDFVIKAHEALVAVGANTNHAFTVSDGYDLPEQFIDDGELTVDVWEFLEDTEHYRDNGSVSAFIEWNGEWDTDRYHNCYEGRYNSVADFARDRYEDNPPEWLTIDWEQSGHNLMLDYNEVSEHYFRR